MVKVNMKQLRILHTESSCGWGGQELRILNEAKGMQNKGHQVTIACCPDSEIFTAAKKMQLNVVGIPIYKKNLSALMAMKSYLATNSFDIVNTHSSTDSWLVSLVLRMKKERPGIIRTRHLSTPVAKNFTTKWLYKHGNDMIVTTGEQLKKTLQKQFVIPRDKICSIPTGIDENIFQKAENKTVVRENIGLPSDKTIIGIVATIRTWKGHEYLVRAFAKLNSQEALLLIVGDGPNRANIENLVKELGIQQKVKFVGNQENVVPWLQAMDIFALPSFGNEGVPQGLMQAMLCELPIISTNVGSIAEILQDGVNGMRVKEKDVESLTQALRILSASESKRNIFGQNGRQLIFQKSMGFACMINNMQDIFLKTAERINQ